MSRGRDKRTNTNLCPCNYQGWFRHVGWGHLSDPGKCGNWKMVKSQNLALGHQRRQQINGCWIYSWCEKTGSSFWSDPRHLLLCMLLSLLLSGLPGPVFAGPLTFIPLNGVLQVVPTGCWPVPTMGFSSTSFYCLSPRSQCSLYWKMQGQTVERSSKILTESSFLALNYQRVDQHTRCL